jgi:hypothetical protein
LRAASPSEGIYSLLGTISQRLDVRMSPRARPCLRVWSIQMDCSVCRSACGLTRRETNPASAAGSRRALSRETRVVWNGRRLRAVLRGIRATAFMLATLTHAIVRRPMRTRDVIREDRSTEQNSREFSPRKMKSLQKSRLLSSQVSFHKSYVSRLYPSPGFCSRFVVEPPREPQIGGLVSTRFESRNRPVPRAVVEDFLFLFSDFFFLGLESRGFFSVPPPHRPEGRRRDRS